MSRTAASSGRAARAVPGNDQQITVAPFFMASATSRTRHKNTCTVASPGFWCPTSTTQRQRHQRLPKHLHVSLCGSRRRRAPGHDDPGIHGRPGRGNQPAGNDQQSTGDAEPDEQPRHGQHRDPANGQVDGYSQPSGPSPGQQDDRVLVPAMSRKIIA
jgi:hypothetical protein